VFLLRKSLLLPLKTSAFEGLFLNTYNNFDRQRTDLAQKYNMSEEHTVFYGNHTCARFEDAQYGYQSRLENYKEVLISSGIRAISLDLS
jgi:hypothetical protein